MTSSGKPSDFEYKSFRKDWDQLLERQQYKEAEKLCHDGLAKSPLDQSRGRLYNHLGYLYENFLDDKTFDDILEHYVLSLQVDESNANSHYNLANFLLEQGMQHLLRALELNPQHGKANKRYANLTPIKNGTTLDLGGHKYQVVEVVENGVRADRLRRRDDGGYEKVGDDAVYAEILPPVKVHEPILEINKRPRDDTSDDDDDFKANSKRPSKLSASAMSKHSKMLLSKSQILSRHDIAEQIVRSDVLIHGYCREFNAVVPISTVVVDHVLEFLLRIPLPHLTQIAGTSGEFEISTIFDGDGYEVRPRTNFPSIKADICAPTERGKYYYEFIVAKEGTSHGSRRSLAQVGWCDDECTVDQNNDGIGDDGHSWAFDGNRVKKWYLGASWTYGEAWREGDVVGCGIDLKKSQATFVFYLNGKS